MLPACGYINKAAMQIRVLGFCVENVVFVWTLPERVLHCWEK